MTKIEVPITVKMDFGEIVNTLKEYDFVEVVRCKDCKHFELNHWDATNGIPLITAHEICNRWGSGCMTSSEGYCFLAERKDDEKHT